MFIPQKKNKCFKSRTLETDMWNRAAQELVKKMTPINFRHSKICSIFFDLLIFLAERIANVQKQKSNKSIKLFIVKPEKRERERRKEFKFIQMVYTIYQFQSIFQNVFKWNEHLTRKCSPRIWFYCINEKIDWKQWHEC